MDPIFLILFAAGLRFAAKSSHRDARQKCKNAEKEYRNSLNLAEAAHTRCVHACNELDANRQAAHRTHWKKIHTVLVSFGINGGLFARRRGVFGERSEPDVRQVISYSESLVGGHKTPALARARALTRVALSVKGIKYLDTLGIIHVPVLHTTIHDAVVSFGGDDVSSLADSLGAFGGLEIGDAIAGGFSILSIMSSFSIFAEAKEFDERSERLSVERTRLDGQRATLESGTVRARELLVRLQSVSYDLFKWTVVGSEVVRLRSSRHGTRKNISYLPQWILRGLLQRANHLWSILEAPIFV